MNNGKPISSRASAQASRPLSEQEYLALQRRLASGAVLQTLRNLRENTCTLAMKCSNEHPLLTAGLAAGAAVAAGYLVAGGAVSKAPITDGKPEQSENSGLVLAETVRAWAQACVSVQQLVKA